MSILKGLAEIFRYVKLFDPDSDLKLIEARRTDFEFFGSGLADLDTDTTCYGGTDFKLIKKEIFII
jgi:hypothetical protein